MDASSPDFEAATAEFCMLGPEVQSEVISALLQYATTQELSDQIAFFVIVAMKNCVKKAQSESPFLISEEQLLSLLELSKNYFQHTNNAVRTAATNLYSTLLILNPKFLTELEVIPRLQESIHSDSIQEILSGSECLARIGSEYTFGSPEMVQSFVEIIDKYHDNLVVVSHMISTISSFSNVFLIDGVDSTQFIQSILQLFEREGLEESLYNFIIECVGTGLSLIEQFIPFIIERIGKDLESTNDSLFLKACYTLIVIDSTIGERESILNDCVEELSVFLIQKLHSTPLRITNGENGEWDPGIAIIRILQSFCEYHFEILIEIIFSLIQTEGDDENPVCREVSSICLMILTQGIAKIDTSLFEAIFERICTYLEDTSQIVNCYAITSLINMVQFSSESAPFVTLLPTLMEFSLQNELSSIAAIPIYEIFKKKDFTNFECFNTILELIDQAPQNASNYLKLFCIARNQNCPPEITTAALLFLFGLFQVPQHETVLSDIFHEIQKIFIESPVGKIIIDENVCNGLSMLVEMMSEGNDEALTTLCISLNHCSEFIASCMPQIVEAIENALQSKNIQYIKQGIISYFLLLVSDLELDKEAENMIFSHFIGFVHPKAPSVIQSQALEVLSFLIKKNGDPGKSRLIINAVKNYNIENIADLELAEPELFPSVMTAFFDVMIQIAKKGGRKFVVSYTYSLLELKTVREKCKEPILNLANTISQLQDPELQDYISAIYQYFPSEEQ